MREKYKIMYATQNLQLGGLVVFPTETVYGLGADASNSEACLRIFTTKGRPRTSPLIVHASSLEMLVSRVADLPPVALALFKAFSPGPLTIVVKFNNDAVVCPEARAGMETLALRIPSHPVAQHLLREANCLVAAPSANRTGEPSATTYRMAQHVVKKHRIPVLNGGDCEVGIESTILDVSNYPFRILRAGTISHRQIEQACGMQVSPAKQGLGKYPGGSISHYQPSIPVFLFSQPSTVFSCLDTGNTGIGLIVSKNTSRIFNVLPGILLKRTVRDDEHYAHILYKTLDEMERKKCQSIYCELPANKDHPVYDRLYRASSKVLTQP